MSEGIRPIQASVTETALVDDPLALQKPKEPHIPGANLALALLIGINLFNYIDRQVLAAILDSIEKKFLPENGPSNASWLGLLTSVFLVSYMVFAPIFGWLADRMSRWWLIGIGVIVWSLASGASGLSGQLAGYTFTGFYLLLATRAMVGIGEAAYGPAAPAVLSDLYPVSIRGQVMSWFYVAIPVGSAIGFGLGGLAGWPLAFFLVVPPGILLGLACFFLREPQRGLSDSDQGNHHPVKHVSLKDYRRLFRTPSYVLTTSGMACLTFAMGGIAAWVPYYLETIRHLGTKAQVNLTFGGILVVAGLIGTIVGGLTGDALRKVTSGSYFLVSAIAMFLAFPTILCVIWAPPYLIWPSIFFTCFFLFFNTGPTNTILANVTHPHLRTAGFAVNILIIHALGDVVSPSLIGYLADAFATSSVDDLGKVILHRNFEVGFITVSAVLLLRFHFLVHRHALPGPPIAPARSTNSMIDQESFSDSADHPEKRGKT